MHTRHTRMYSSCSNDVPTLIHVHCKYVHKRTKRGLGQYVPGTSSPLKGRSSPPFCKGNTPSVPSSSLAEGVVVWGASSGEWGDTGVEVTRSGSGPLLTVTMSLNLARSLSTLSSSSVLTGFPPMRSELWLCFMRGKVAWREGGREGGREREDKVKRVARRININLPLPHTCMRIDADPIYNDRFLCTTGRQW